MGRELYAAFPVFAAAFDDVCSAMDPQLDRSLRDVVLADGDSGPGPEPEPGERAVGLIDHTVWAQCGLFAVEVALYRLLEWFGLRPEVLAGHSVGEIVAAHLAGVLNLPDAATLVTARGRLMQCLPAGGAMVALEATEHEVLAALTGTDRVVGIAAINGPRAVVVSGSRPAVEAVAGGFADLGRRITWLRVSHAFHSGLMQPMLSEFSSVASTLRWNRPTMPILSGITGQLARPEQLASADYWVDQISQPVRFADAVAGLRKFGADTLLEVSPSAALAPMMEQCLIGEDVVVVPVQRSRRPEAATLLRAIAKLWAGGIDVSWPVLHTERGARVIDLPMYPFQRRPFWLYAAPTHPSTGSPAAATEVGPVRPAEREVNSPGRSDRSESAPPAAGSLLELVRSVVAEVLEYESPEDVDPDREFLELGFDSLAATELARRLQTATGVELSSRAMFDFPTAHDLSRHLESGAPVVAEVSGRAGCAATSLDALFVQAIRDGCFEEAQDLASRLARFRPTFHASGERPTVDRRSGHAGLGWPEGMGNLG